MASLNRHSFSSERQKDGLSHEAQAVDEEAAMSSWPNPEDGDIEKAIRENEGRKVSTEISTAERHIQHPVPKTNKLGRIFTRTPAVQNLADDLEPPPDGGTLAWTQVACVHLTIFSTFGYITSFGAFQTYYETALGVAPSTISWIGSVQIFLLFFIGTFSGRALDAGLFQIVYVSGAVFQLLGIFTTSAATTFWQLFLAQALCSGIANGLQFCPAMSLITTYFAKKRALVVGIAALGSCSGGVVIPVIVQQLLPRIGFPWTVRVIGFVMLATNITTILLYRTRLPPRKTGPIFEWAAFREAPYSLYCAAMFFNYWGLYFTFFYIGSYGRDILGVSYSESIDLLLTVVCVGFIFRLLPNYFADRIGTLNVLIPFAYLCGIMMFAWIGVRSVAGLFVFAAIYGSGSAGIQSLFPALFNSLSKHPDLQKAGVRMGMAFSLVSFAVLTGAPLGGALIQARNGDYLYAQIWGGLSFFLGGTLLIATRFAKVGWNWKARI